jgi:hypothetical protein
MPICFKCLCLFLIVFCNQPLWSQSPPRIVSTFHSFGIYWSPTNGANDIKCHVNYRRNNSSTWRAAQDLWFDDRSVDGRQAEYRGSIVNLEPGTDYVVQLWLEDDFRTEIMLDASTWSEAFPIAKVVELAVNSSQTLTIHESGTEAGYVLYTTSAGKSAVIDCSRDDLFNILVAENTHHIIIRGVTLRNAARHGIRISDFCHDIVIEKCDISGWGEVDSSGYGVNLNAAISAAYRSNNIERLVIQDNRIHHPFGDANSWGEPRPNGDGDPYHPQGPYGLVFYDTKGNHVIRNNIFETDDDHYFADHLGAGSNISFEGFPNCDSDIYGNSFQRCWDDAVEAEGANENVRIWGNYFDHVYHPIGAIVTSVGPLYVWRNIVAQSRKFGHLSNSDDYGRGEFIKCGGVWQNGARYGDGRMYVYHNTLLQPDAPGNLLSLGCEGALVAEGKSLYNVVTRNNIFTNYKSDSYTFRNNPDSDADCGRNDFDFDMYTGRIKETCSQIEYEQHGIYLESNDLIVFDPISQDQNYALLPGTPGFDAGLVLPNFNNDFRGAAPDMGAVESQLDTGVSDIHLTSPQSIRLLHNFPNPFNTLTKIKFLSVDAFLSTLVIYNVAGERLKSIRVQAQAGENTIQWDGRDDAGMQLASGVYFYRLFTGAWVTRASKLVLLR